MKRQLSLIMCLCTAFLFFSCDDEETFDDQWKNANEAQFAKISADSRYTRLNSESAAGYIMYREINSGTGQESPLFTDKVKVLYTGWFKYDWEKGDTYQDEKGQTVTNKIVFDSTENRNNIPSTFNVNGVIDGYRTALQNMKVGDKWEIWIPWRLGYGDVKSSGSNIEAYSTLVFEVELVDIVD